MGKDLAGVILQTNGRVGRKTGALGLATALITITPGLTSPLKIVQEAQQAVLSGGCCARAWCWVGGGLGCRCLTQADRAV